MAGLTVAGAHGLADGCTYVVAAGVAVGGHAGYW
jgi:hypothetical protein